MPKFTLGLISGVLLTAAGARALVALRNKEAQANSTELLHEELGTQQLADWEEQQEVYNTAEEVETVAESSVTSPAEDPEKSC